MKISCFLKDKSYAFIIFLVCYIIILFFFIAFKLENALIVAFSLILIFGFSSCLLIDYWRKKTFYTNLVCNARSLDRAYLVTSTMTDPDFYEGRLTMEVLYKMTSSMNENVSNITTSLADFKDYLELWIHEIKLPLASLILMSHNRPELFDRASLEQIRRIQSHVERILYYVRQENSEKDYLIKEVSLSKTINSIAVAHKDLLLESDVALLVHDIAGTVYTDSKWLEFILGQIIDNAVKYRRSDVESHITIWTEQNESALTLYIEDNGMGIPSADLPRVFEKSFTGQNGRHTSKSTGMGLYIVFNLLKKLGHDIRIDSVENSHTKVAITFYKNNFYEVL